MPDLYPNQDLVSQSLWSRYFKEIPDENINEDRVIMGPWKGGVVVPHTVAILGYDDATILSWLNECAMRLIFKLTGPRIDVPFLNAATAFEQEVEIARHENTKLIIPQAVHSVIPALGVDLSIMDGVDVFVDMESSKTKDNWVVNLCHVDGIHYKFSPLLVIGGNIITTLTLFVDREEPLGIRYLRLQPIKEREQNPFSSKIPFPIQEMQPYIFGMETDELLTRDSFYLGEIFFDEVGVEVPDGQ